MLRNFFKGKILRKLKDMQITHISLVKAGANNKSIIYKSAKSEPSYFKDVEIKKSDEELGVVYGIVYSPDEIDSQGDYTDKDEIVKASYKFMKERNTLNVDKEHDFKNVDAFVAESWIVKANDPIFPNEKVGSWAVAIKLESDELKKAVKEGQIAGLSMAGQVGAFEEKEDLGVLKALIKILKGEKKERMDENMQKIDEKVQKLEQELKETKESIKALEEANKQILATLQKSRQDVDFKKAKIDENIASGGIL